MRIIPSPSMVTKRESTRYHEASMSCPEHCSPTKYSRLSRCSHGDVVMLFCPSFTQSERFLQTDQPIIRECVQVRCSDLVGIDLPHQRPCMLQNWHLERASLDRECVREETVTAAHCKKYQKLLNKFLLRKFRPYLNS